MSRASATIVISPARTAPQSEESPFVRRAFQRLRAHERAVIAVYILTELLIRAWLIHSGAFPAGHDGFQRFYLQKAFFEELAHSGSYAEWLPYLTMGTVASWWSVIAGAPLLGLLGFAAPLFQGADFRVLFWLADGADRILFFLGLGFFLRANVPRASAGWLSAFLVSLSISDVLQPWYNSRIFFLMPWAMLFAQLFLITAKWRYFALASVFSGYQIYCGLPYFILVVSFLLFAFWLVMLAVEPRLILARLSALFRRPVRAGAALLAAAAPAAAFVWLNLAGTNEIVNYNPGRGADGRVSLFTFLEYAKIPDHANWLEMMAGVSPCVDYTLFISALAFALIILGIASADYRTQARPVAFLIYLYVAYSFVAGSFVAIGAYYLWPGMKWMRHLSQVAPFLKIIAAYFLALGVRQVFLRRRGPSRLGWIVFITAAVASLCLAAWSAFSFNGADFWLRHMGAARVQGHPSLSISYAQSAALAALLISTPLFALLVLAARGAGRMARCGSILLLVASALIFRLERDYSGMSIPGPRSGNFFAISPMEFNTQRLRFLHEYCLEAASLPRAELYLLPPPYRYWSEALFWRKEEIGASFRVDHWLAGVDDLWKEYDKRRIEEFGDLFRELNEPSSAGETDAVTALKPPGGLLPAGGFAYPHFAQTDAVTGGSRPKLRFFAKSDESAAPEEKPQVFAKRDPDRLFLSGPHSQPGMNSNRAAEADIAVTAFSANQITLRVRNGAPGFLYYADANHSGWSARVNGQPAPVLTANLAFKAVEIGPGENTVEFRFHLPFYQLCHRLLAAAGAGVLFFAAAFTASPLRMKRACGHGARTLKPPAAS